jgi:hypothetical protein
MKADAKIVNLFGETSDPRIASNDVVALLDDKLEKAEAGEIVGLAVAFCYFDGSVGREMAGMIPSALVGSLYHLLDDAVKASK